MSTDPRRLAPFALALIVAVGLAAAFRMRGCDGVGGPAPDFEAVIRAGDGRGDRVQMAEQRGRVVVLDFWAHWCRPCRESTPILNRLAERFRDRGVSFYGVNVEDGQPPRSIIRYHRQLGASFPTFHDQDGAIQADYGVRRLPTLVVVDRAGEVAHRETGVPDPQSLAALIQGLL